MIIDAKDLILGRVASYAAKQAMLGQKIDIVNAELSIITGQRLEIIKDYKRRFEMGIHTKGPFHYKMPDRFMRRAIRGMLPYKTHRGREAYEKIKCHLGIPDQFKSQKPQTIVKAHVDKVPHTKYITVKEICNEMGARLK